MNVNKLGKQFELTPSHIDTKILEKMRFESDDLADEAISNINNSKETHIDALKKSTFKSCQILLNQVSYVPSWVNFNKIKQAQVFYYKWLPFMLQILLNYSLIGGFASPKVIKVLNCTCYSFILKLYINFMILS